MIKQLTVKQIFGIIIALVVAAYVVWYVIDALEGFDPDYVPTRGVTGGDEEGDLSAGRVTVVAFDPSKKTPEPGSTE